jgi:hypothetical protein
MRTQTYPALRRLKQEDFEFKASWGYIPSPCLKKKESRNAGAHL